MFTRQLFVCTKGFGFEILWDFEVLHGHVDSHMLTFRGRLAETIFRSRYDLDILSAKRTLKVNMWPSTWSRSGKNRNSKPQKLKARTFIHLVAHSLMCSTNRFPQRSAAPPQRPQRLSEICGEALAVELSAERLDEGEVESVTGGAHLTSVRADLALAMFLSTRCSVCQAVYSQVYYTLEFLLFVFTRTS